VALVAPRHAAFENLQINAVHITTRSIQPEITILEQPDHHDHQKKDPPAGAEGSFLMPPGDRLLVGDGPENIN
jgi:hypothetical protein